MIDHEMECSSFIHRRFPVLAIVSKNDVSAIEASITDLHVSQNFHAMHGSVNQRVGWTLDPHSFLILHWLVT